MIARDYAGTALLVLITLGLLAGGLTHRSAVLEERADQRAVFAAVHDYVAHERARVRRRPGDARRVRLEPDSYRACVYGPEKLPLCLFVNTDQSPAGVTRDPSREPNALLATVRARAAAASRGTRGSRRGTRPRRRRRGSGGRR